MKMRWWSWVVAVPMVFAGCDGCDRATTAEKKMHTAGTGDAGQPDRFALPVGTLFDGDSIPLERICEAFTSGYSRYTLVVLMSLSGGVVAETVDTCGGEADDRSFDYITHGPEMLKIDCRPDAPSWPRTLSQRLQASVQAGRASYDGTLALRCIQDGRELIDRQGGVLGLSPDMDAGVVDGAEFSDNCSHWLVGQVATGDACEEHWECAAEYFCKRSLESCTGVCTAQVNIGDSCDPFDQCVSGSCEQGVCIEEEDVEEEGARAGERCGDVEAGWIDCLPELYCNEETGFCQQLPGDGEDCLDEERCAEPYVCGHGSDGPVCALPRAAGVECTEYDSSCELCSPCTPETDQEEGLSYCRAFKNENETCGAGIGPCLMGLVCISGTCRGPVTRGLDCFVDPLDNSLNGNCLAADDYCQNTCQQRVDEGDTCQAPPLEEATRGSCNGSYLFCERTSADATQGVCARQPVAGQACGNHYDRAECLDAEPMVPMIVVTSCQDLDDTGRGVCLEETKELNPGDPCLDSYECPANHFCSQETETCTEAPQLGEECGDDSDYMCQDSRCEYTERDSGYGYLCIPYRNPGDPCDYSGDTSCGPTGRCVGEDGGHFCGPLGELGEMCEDSTQCQDGLSCDRGLCVGGEPCPRDSCQGCNDASFLSAMLVFASVFVVRRKR